MKKLFFLTAAVIFLVFGVKSSFGQSGCVSCNNNVIDTLNFSSAIGTENISTGINSFASGYQNQALGDYSFVSGRESKSLRNYSAVIGSWSTTDGLHSFVIGSQSKSLSNYGYIFGRSSKVQNSSAMLIGYYLSSGANSQIVVGNGLDTLQPLTCNQPYSLAVGFNSTVPTFFVGQSSGAGTSGRIGIGNVTEPQAKLHIRADANEHATLRLETTGSNKHSRLYFSDDIYLTASPQNNLSFTLPENNNLIFENGNVGIGTSQPQAKLHVHGDFQVGDTANPQNMRLYGSINATGECATAFGTGNTAGGNYSFVAGENSKANGRSSFSLGQSTNVYDNYALGIGRYLEVYGSSSLAIGRYLKTLSSESMVIGYGFSETQTLDNNVNRSLMIGFGSTKPTLFVGPTVGVNNTGKIGIGNVTDPQAKLHIRADANEHATLRLEATGSNKHSRLYFSDDIYLTASPQNNLSFTLPENNNLIFENGNVGIGTFQPEAKLHVHGDFQVGDTANPQNMRLYGSINAMGEFGTAFGDGSTASGNYSFVAGRNSHILSTPDFPGHYSNIIGSWSKIENGAHANVIGSFSQALNDFSFVLGTYSKAKGSYSYALGSHVEAWSGGSFVIGEGRIDAKLINTIPNSLMIGFGSSLPTLFVEKAPFSFEEDLTGRVGIGNVTEPQAKLHIRADANEHATLRLEATGSDKHARINFTDAHQILTSANDDMHFHTAEGKGYIFHGGDIFLSDIQSGIIMKSPNGQCWRGVMSDNGQLVFSATDCPDGAVSVPKPTVEPALQMKIYPNPTDGNITIEVPDGVTNADWSLRSTDGALLMRNRITSGKTEISLAHFVAGVYVISIEQNGRLIASEKVVKQ
jgi:hypothetical protein